MLNEDGRPDAAKDRAVLTKAVARAADWLGLSDPVLAEILGASLAQIARLRAGGAVVDECSDVFNAAGRFVRVFQTLDELTAGDQTAARAWISSPNSAFGARPVDLMVNEQGLLDVFAYLDGRATSN